MDQFISKKRLKHQKRNGNDNKEKRTDKHHKSQEERVETEKKNAAKRKEKTRDNDIRGLRDHKYLEENNDHGALQVVPTMEEIEREEELEIALEAAEAEERANAEYRNDRREVDALEAKIKELEAQIIGMYQALDDIENITHMEGDIEFARQQLLSNIEELHVDLDILLHDVDIAIGRREIAQVRAEIREIIEETAWLRRNNLELPFAEPDAEATNEVHNRELAQDGVEVHRDEDGVALVYEHDVREAERQAVVLTRAPIATYAVHPNIPAMLEAANEMVTALNNVRPLVGLHMDAHSDCG